VPEDLATYYERSLSLDEIPAFEAHIARCARCREELAAMVRAEVPPHPAARHVWLLDWRLLATAGVSLAIVTILFLHRAAPRLAVDRAANAPLVAMSDSRQSVAPQPPQAQNPANQPAPPAEHPVESRSQPENGKVAPKLQAAQPEAQPWAQKKAPVDFPPDVAGRENQLKMNSAQQTVIQADRLANPQAPAALDENKSKTPAAPAPPASGAASPSPAPPQPEQTAQAHAGAGAIMPPGTATSSAALQAGKQPGSGREVQSFGAADVISLAQAGEARSAQTIIRTPNPKVLWRIAGAGFIERSEDGGATWNGQLPESNAHFDGGAAPTTKVLWLVGENGMILFTKDTTHWKKIPPPIPADFISVDASSASSAIVTAADGQKFSTYDGGKKWIPSR
jgi:hypothetical protein